MYSQYFDQFSARFSYTEIASLWIEYVKQRISQIYVDINVYRWRNPNVDLANLF